MIEIKETNEFYKLISGPQLSVVHFAAKWAEQCSHMNTVLEEIAKQTRYIDTAVKFCKCEAEDLSDISLQYNIVAAPTILFFNAGKVIDRIDGADALQLNKKLSEHCTPGKAPPVAEHSTLPLVERLKQLINRHKIVIFMKGNREQPRCGFSKQLIQIVNDMGVEYDTFDILSDEEVRQGLKTYSDWPTYPQLYVNGELIGGLDIIKEMKAAGDLESSLKG